MDTFERFLSKIPAMARPFVTEWLHESGVLVGMVTKSYQYETNVSSVGPRKTWQIEVWEIVTGEPSFYAVAATTVEASDASLPERRQFCRFIRDRFDTVESFCSYVNEQLQRTVDV
jgi:hypothetical protein